MLCFSVCWCWSNRSSSLCVKASGCLPPVAFGGNLHDILLINSLFRFFLLIVSHSLTMAKSVTNYNNICKFGSCRHDGFYLWDIEGMRKEKRHMDMQHKDDTFRFLMFDAVSNLYKYPFNCGVCSLCCEHVHIQ